MYKRQEFTGSACLDNDYAFNAGLSYFDTGNFDYTALSGSFRLQTGRYLSPFVGLGLGLGYGAKHESSSSDGLDNDNDGDVDEFGELRVVDTSFSAFVYPEVGVSLYTNDVGLNASIRRHYGNTYDQETVFSLGVNFTFELNDLFH